MSISERQFTLLQAMGITVWQRRCLSVQPVKAIAANTASAESVSLDTVDAKNQQTTMPNEAVNCQVSTTDNSKLDLKTLLAQQLFTDIIHCLGVDHADLSIQNNQIDLGMINWQFSQNKNIEFDHNCLTTPDLETIANSVELKKSLWQSIGLLSSS